jgi:hypothetical protein
VTASADLCLRMMWVLKKRVITCCCDKIYFKEKKGCHDHPHFKQTRQAVCPRNQRSSRLLRPARIALCPT